MIRIWRAAALALGTTAGAMAGAIAGAVAFAGPAAADVTVTPSAAIRGGPANLSFHVPEERPGAYTTKVELVAPEATPVAEIYPMSVDGWAPTTKTRKLDRPVELIHGASTTEVPSSVTWIRFGDAPPGPSQPAVLTVSLGPMPQTDRVTFTIVQTYSDGTVVRWGDAPAAGSSQPQHPAPIVTLLDPEPAGGNTDPADSADSADPAAAVARNGKSDGNGADGVLESVLLVGLVAGLGLEGWAILRAVRRYSLAGSGSSLAGPK